MCTSVIVHLTTVKFIPYNIKIHAHYDGFPVGEVKYKY